jgi:hypothetical protein
MQYPYSRYSVCGPAVAELRSQARPHRWPIHWSARDEMTSYKPLAAERVQNGAVGGTAMTGTRGDECRQAVTNSL